MSRNGCEPLAERMPPELWTRVFHQGREDYGASAGYMLSLATVCKVWMEPAIIALYHTVHMSKIVQITSLARSVSSETHNRGRFIRHLAFYLDHDNEPASAEEMALWMEASHTVLFSATQMVSFWSANVLSDVVSPTFGSHLAAVRVAAESTLRSLHLTITNKHARSILFHLKSFARLESLRIMTGEEYAISSELITGVSPGRWNEVKHVHLDLQGRRGYDTLEQYLLACRFPRVQIIVLSLRQLGPQHGEGVMSFLDAHKTTCKTLSFLDQTAVAKSARFCQRLGPVLLNTAHHLKIIPAAIPILDIFQYWAPDVKIAKLTFDISFGLTDHGSLWQLLKKILQKDFRPRGLQLDIVCRHSTFLWGFGAHSKEQAEFVGKLISFALELAPKGVSIADQSGKVLVPAVLYM